MNETISEYDYHTMELEKAVYGYATYIMMKTSSSKAGADEQVRNRVNSALDRIREWRH
jgi:hypothetical protein